MILPAKGSSTGRGALDGVVLTADHERQGACRRALHPAGDRRVELGVAAFGRLRVDLAGVVDRRWWRCR